MKPNLLARIDPDVRFRLLLLGAFSVPISIVLAQVFLFLSVLVWAVDAVRARQRPHSPFTGWIVAFLLVWCVGLLYAVRPELGLRKLNRGLLFLLVFAVPGFVNRTQDRPRAVLQLGMAFLAGISLLGVYDLVRIPMAAWQAPRLGEPGYVEDGWKQAMFHAGNMRDPQFYLCGLLLCLGFSTRSTKPASRWLLLAGGLCAAGLLLHNKRGAWLVFLIVATLWLVLQKRWRSLVLLAVLAGAASATPFVQARLGQLREVFMPEKGNRLILYTHVAPKLLREYPFGFGYAGTLPEDFRQRTPSHLHLDPKLKHLHNNALQIGVELGWHGLAIWVAWMLVALRLCLKAPDPATRHTLFALLAGLLLLGMVEYNFGDKEVLMLYLMLLGAIGWVADAQRVPVRPGDAAPPTLPG